MQLIDKLLILDYRLQFCVKRDFKPISRVFFAIPAKGNEQFLCFTALSGWLLQLCGSNFMDMADLESHDPNSVCTNLLAELKKLGFQVIATSNLSSIARFNRI